jgi:hypothetical protein
MKLTVAVSTTPPPSHHNGAHCPHLQILYYPRLGIRKIKLYTEIVQYTPPVDFATEEQVFISCGWGVE